MNPNDENDGLRADWTDDLREGVADGEAGFDPTVVYRDIVSFSETVKQFSLAFSSVTNSYFRIDIRCGGR